MNLSIAGYLNTVQGVIMYTLILNITYREYRDNSCIVIFFSYGIVTLKFQYRPALVAVNTVKILVLL